VCVNTMMLVPSHGVNLSTLASSTLCNMTHVQAYTCIDVCVNECGGGATNDGYGNSGMLVT